MDTPKQNTPADPEPAASLEKVVVEKGWATPEQVAAAAKFQSEKKIQGELISLSQALVTLGTLTATQAREALGEEKTSMRCLTCRKVFNVWGKPGARTLCRTCKTPLVPTGASFPVPSGEGEPKSGATPAAPAPVATVAAAEAVPAADAPAVAAAAPVPAAEPPVPAPPAEALDPALVNLIAGYRIIRRLGSGGMGDVFLAQQTSLDRPVAVKLLPTELAKDQVFVQRFMSEARAAGKVTHENIVAAVDVGESNGRYYFVMELVEGPTLQQTIQREGALAESRALETARQIARGLRHAHQQNLIHRDIKPANIMIAPNNVAKICDFGLARDLNTDVTLTIPGLVQSSPAYASPEQCRGRRDLDHRTDMYSLGVTLFEMLTGKRPFLADSPGALFIKHATEAPPSPQSLNPSLSPAAAQLVLRLLKKEPRQRFDSYDQLIQAIEAAQKTGKAPMAKAARPGTVRRATQNRQPVVIGIAAAVLLLGAAGFLFFRSKPAPAPAARKGPSEPEAKSARVDPEIERLLAAVTLLEKRTEDNPSEIPSVRDRWKELGEKYRGTPTFAVITRRQGEFEAKVAAMSEALAAQTVGEAQTRRQSGRPAEALQMLWNFPKAFEGTEAATRVAAIADELGKTVEDLYRAEREKVLVLVAAGKAEEAMRALTQLKIVLSATNAEGKNDFIRADYREEFGKLIARIEESAKPDRPKTDVPAARAEPQPLVAGNEPRPAVVGVPDYVLVLKTPATRANPQERTRAAVAFRGLAPRSALCRAAEIFLAHDDKFWKLGGATPLTKIFGDYLAGLPLERADSLSTAEHLGFFVNLTRKISELGETPKEVLTLFAMAHADELLGQNLRLDAESVRLAKLQSAKSADYWGPAASVNRVHLTRLICIGSPPVELRRAIDAVSTTVDFPTRYLTALAGFREKEFDPSAAAAAWKKLAAMAPETPGSKYSDEVAERLKKALVCDTCAGAGKYACKKCMATGIADCDRCKGTGRVKENPDSTSTFGYTVPCPICKQKGKFTCPVCQGGKIQKCEKCDGKKVKKTLPAADWIDVLNAYLCPSCAGTGSAFARTAYPCPDCDGFGRFPTNVSGIAPVRAPDPAAAPLPREGANPTPAPLPASASDQGALQPGLTAQGFSGENFEKLESTHVDRAIDFKFNQQGSPPAAWPGGPGEHFSIRWTGWLKVNETGKHFFKAMSDDGVRLFIDDVQILEDWEPHAPRQAAALIDLTKGQHKIRVDYYNSGLGGEISLSWQPPSASALAVIPADAFKCPRK